MGLLFPGIIFIISDPLKASLHTAYLRCSGHSKQVSLFWTELFL